MNLATSLISRSMGMARLLFPLPVTPRRRAPAGPTIETMPKATASPSRIPDTKNRATSARSRVGQGWRAGYRS